MTLFTMNPVGWRRSQSISMAFDCSSISNARMFLPISIPPLAHIETFSFGPMRLSDPSAALDTFSVARPVRRTGPSETEKRRKEGSEFDQGARNEGTADPRRLLYLTGQILDPVCPGLRPLLQGLSGDSAPPAPNAWSSPGDDRGVEVGDVVTASEDANRRRPEESPALDHSDDVRGTGSGDSGPRTVGCGDEGNVPAQPDAARRSSVGMTEKKAFPQEPPDTPAESSLPDGGGGQDKAEEAVATKAGAGSWSRKGHETIEVSMGRGPEGPRAAVVEPVRARTAQIV